MSKAGTWAYSFDGEVYEGTLNSRETAMRIAKNVGASRIGQWRSPIAPEQVVSGANLIDELQCYDEYHHDEGEAWLDGLVRCEGDLTIEIRKVFAGWLERHGLRPAFFLIKSDTIEAVQ